MTATSQQEADPRWWLQCQIAIEPSITDACGECGHCRDRHASTKKAPCRICPCTAGGDWRISTYQGSEWITDKGDSV